MMFALRWLNKSVLTQDDLEKVQTLFQEENKLPETEEEKEEAN